MSFLLKRATFLWMITMLETCAFAETSKTFCSLFTSKLAKNPMSHAFY
jgi:hypothetical protein